MCKVVPCGSDQAKNHCPITCGKTVVDDLCEIAECSTKEARSMCPTKCKDEEGNRQIHVPEYSLNLDIHFVYINVYF